MRNVSTHVRQRGVLLALVVVLVAGTAYADVLDPYEYEPPQSRIRPPIGLTADEEESLSNLVWAWLMARIAPPIGLQ